MKTWQDIVSTIIGVGFAVTCSLACAAVIVHGLQEDAREAELKATQEIAIEAEPVESTGATVKPTVEAIREIEAAPETEVLPVEVVDPLPPVERPTKEQAVKVYDIPLGEDLQIHITRLCEEHHIEPTLIFAMIARESGYNPAAMGDGGKSYGLMQIQLRYVRQRMDKLGCTDLLDPYQNVAVGIDLISEYISKGYGLEWALMAYNGGEAYAYRLRANGYVSDYARAVIARSEEMKGECG